MFFLDLLTRLEKRLNKSFFKKCKKKDILKNVRAATPTCISFFQQKLKVIRSAALFVQCFIKEAWRVKKRTLHFQFIREKSKLERKKKHLTGRAHCILSDSSKVTVHQIMAEVDQSIGFFFLAASPFVRVSTAN